MYKPNLHISCNPNFDESFNLVLKYTYKNSCISRILYRYVWYEIKAESDLHRINGSSHVSLLQWILMTVLTTRVQTDRSAPTGSIPTPAPVQPGLEETTVQVNRPYRKYHSIGFLYRLSELFTFYTRPIYICPPYLSNIITCYTWRLEAIE